MAPDAEGTAQATSTPEAEATVETTPVAPAPQAGEQSGGESPPPEATQTQETVDAKRFNSLMAEFNRKQAELQKKEQELARERAQRRQLEQRVLTPEELELAEKSELQEALAQTQAELIMTRLESTKEKLLQEHPDVRVFADLIVADTAEDMEALVEDLASRVAMLKPGQQTPEQFAQEGAAGAVQTQTPPPAQVLPGSPGYQGQNTGDDLETLRVEYNKDRRNFGGIMQKLYEKQQQNAAQVGG